MKRKTICCISIRPDEVYQQRVIEGLRTQCARYDYNLAVFAPFVDISHYYKDNLEGELNILRLPDFDKFDAVILVSIPFVVLGNADYLTGLYNRIKKSCTKPVISLDYPFDDCETVYTDDINAFTRITDHIIEKHDCKNIHILTGQQGFDVSERRKKGYTNSLVSHGIPVDESKVHYGDFWYTSGEALAARILSGEVEMPDAVVCAGDHMAIGLVNALEKAGVKIPGQLIVTGYETAPEAVTNPIGITSYIPDVAYMAAVAVNKIRALIEPDKSVEPPEIHTMTGIFIGESCGCKVDSVLQKRHLNSSLFKRNRNYGDDTTKNNEDIAGLLESYMLETLTKSESPLECLKLIYSSTYLLQPFSHFYLCLRTDWLDTESILTEGYPGTMRCVMHSAPMDSSDYKDDVIHCRNDNKDNFDTSIMLPNMWGDCGYPSVFYFAPVHFSNDTLGYSVLQCRLDSGNFPASVYHNWTRNVNNALEMTRAKNKLISYSLVDSMTKLCNRRGLKIRINDMLRIAEPDDSVMAMVIDMDGLKRINDTYGHNEGDYAITTIASVVRCITDGNEVACRAGGDEFYLLGVGKYTDEKPESKIERFYSILEGQNNSAMKPFEITGSVGYALKKASEVDDITELIAVADSNMYTSKLERKKHRK